MVISAPVLRAANKGFRKLYDGGLASIGKPRIDTYAMRTTSRSKDETYGWLGAMPQMRKLVGEINVRNLANHGFAVINEPFEVTVAVKREEIERDNLGIYSNFFTGMGTSAGRHPDRLLATALTTAFDTECYTGKKFFDADHEPQKGKGKFSNLATKKLSAANFVKGMQSLEERKDAEGEPINDNPDVTLVVSPKYRETAENILVASNLAAGATNVNKGKANLDVWNRLSGAATEDMWFLIDNGGVVKAFVHQIEVPLEYTELADLRDPNVFYKKQFEYQAYGRYAVAALVPELCYGSTGEDAA